MKEKIVIHPERFRHFGDPSGRTFCLLTSPALLSAFEVRLGGKYSAAHVIAFAGTDELCGVLRDRVPEQANILVIAPASYFQSPPPEVLGSTRKLSVMACNSTPTSLAAIEHFLLMGERLDPEQQEAFATRFFDAGRETSVLVFRDVEHDTEAVFTHLDDDYQWHEQVGFLAGGGQQLFPSGEISVLPVGLYGEDVRHALDVHGKIVLKGHPVLHSGTPSFTVADQHRLFSRLRFLSRAPVVATVDHGQITALEAPNPDAAPAVEMLEALFAMDSRYRTILEIGFSVNTTLELFPGNAAMNEVHGGRGGIVHWGLGLIPYTQFHLDVLSPSTVVFDDKGRVVFGDASTRRMRRNKSAMCPCMTSSFQN